MSSSQQKRTLVLFGSGPGIAQSVATEFASHGFSHIVLLARNAERLEAAKAAVKSASNAEVQIDTVTVDLSSSDSVEAAIRQVDQITSIVDAIIYNGARVAPTALFDTPIADIESDFRTTIIGLYLVSKWAIPKLQASKATNLQGKPSLIVTSGNLHLYPDPNLFSLALTKTAQRNFVQSLHLKFNSQDLHVGMVVVGGVVTPQKKVLNPDNIARTFWKFFDEDQYSEALEIELEEPKSQ